MHTTDFTKKIPLILLFLGSGLWIYSLFFDLPVNATESQVYEFTKDQLLASEPLLQFSNQSTKQGVEQAIIARPDDRPFLEAIEQVESYATQFKQQIEEQPIENGQQIITAFNDTLSQLLDDLEKNNPIIVEDEVKMLKEQRLVSNLSMLKNKKYTKVILKNNIQIRGTALISYFSSKVGGTVICCLDYYRPSLSLDPTLIAGKVYNSQIYLMHSNHCSQFPLAVPSIKINHQSFPLDDHNFVSYSTTFKDSLPKKILVEYKILDHSIVNRKLVIDTIPINKTFTIYPLKNANNEK